MSSSNFRDGAIRRYQRQPVRATRLATFNINVFDFRDGAIRRYQRQRGGTKGLVTFNVNPNISSRDGGLMNLNISSRAGGLRRYQRQKGRATKLAPFKTRLRPFNIFNIIDLASATGGLLLHGHSRYVLTHALKRHKARGCVRNGIWP